MWGATPDDRAACLEAIAPLRNEGIFTPPSIEGTLVMPSNIGGAHWGGVAIDPSRQIAVVPVNRLAAMVQLIPAEQLNADSMRVARVGPEAMDGGLQAGDHAMLDFLVGVVTAVRRVTI